MEIKNIYFEDCDYNTEKILTEVITFCSNEDTNGNNGKEASHFTSDYDIGYINGLCGLAIDKGSWICDDAYLLNMYEMLVNNRVYKVEDAIFEIVAFHNDLVDLENCVRFEAKYDSDHGVFTIVKF